MECEKIQTFISEYLDKELNEDMSKRVRDHLLVCKVCGNVYFSMKSAVKELACLEKFKAPYGFLDSVNQSVYKRSWFRNISNIFPGFKIPMEFVTVAATAVLVILIFTNLQIDKNDENRNLEPGQIQTASRSSSEMTIKGTNPVDLDFYINDNKKGRHPSSDNVLTVGSGEHFTQTDIGDFFEEIEDDFSLFNKGKTISDINEIILSAGGDVVSRNYRVDPASPEIITVKIPSGNYNSFINEIEKIGRFKPPAPSLTDNSPDFVFLKMRLNLPE